MLVTEEIRSMQLLVIFIKAVVCISVVETGIEFSSLEQLTTAFISEIFFHSSVLFTTNLSAFTTKKRLGIVYKLSSSPVSCCLSLHYI